MKEKKYLVGVVALIILCVLGWFLYYNFKPETQEGNKKIDVVVVHGNQEEKTFHYETDVGYLGDVLTKEGLIEGEESQYGLFITTVDGEKADDSKQQWWCITQNGEQVNTSVSQTPVIDGEQYELTLKEGY